MTRFAGVLEAWLDARPPVIIKATTATAASSPVIFRTTQRQKPFDNGWIGLKTLSHRNTNFTIKRGRALFVCVTALVKTSI